jgi:hypothetical protein
VGLLATQSLSIQGNTNGNVHPNPLGQSWYAQQLLAELRRNLR